MKDFVKNQLRINLNVENVIVSIAFCVLLSIKIGLVQSVSANYVFAKTFRFYTDQEYCLYLSGIVLYAPAIFSLCYWIIKKYINDIKIEKKLSVLAGLIAIGMASGRVIGENFYFVSSWELIQQAPIASGMLWISWAVVFFYLLRRIMYFVYYSDLPKQSVRIIDVYIGKLSSNRQFLCILLWFLVVYFPRLVINYPVCTDYDTGFILLNAIWGVEWTGYAAQNYILRLFVKLAQIIGLPNSLYVYMIILYVVTCLFFTWIFHYFRPTGDRMISSVIWSALLLFVSIIPQYQSWLIIVSKDANYGICIGTLFFLLILFIYDKNYLMKHKLLCGVLFAISILGVYTLRKNGPILLGVVMITGIIVVFPWKKIIVNKKAFIGVIFGLSLLAGSICVGNKIVEEKIESKTFDDRLYMITKFPFEYYRGRILYFIKGDVVARNAMAISGDDTENLPQGMLDILGDCVEEYKTSNRMGGFVHIYGIDDEQENQLFMWLLRNEKGLVVQSFINEIFAHFDVWRGSNADGWDGGAKLSRVTSDASHILGDYEETEEVWDSIENNWSRYLFLDEAYSFIEGLPIVGKLCNPGGMIWLMIISVSLLLIKKGKNILFPAMIPVFSLMGSLMSGYNAYMRLMIPIIVSIPILCFELFVDRKKDD